MDALFIYCLVSRVFEHGNGNSQSIKEKLTLLNKRMFLLSDGLAYLKILGYTWICQTLKPKYVLNSLSAILAYTRIQNTGYTNTQFKDNNDFHTLKKRMTEL